MSEQILLLNPRRRRRRYNRRRSHSRRRKGRLNAGLRRWMAAHRSNPRRRRRRYNRRHRARRHNMRRRSYRRYSNRRRHHRRYNRRHMRHYRRRSNPRGGFRGTGRRLSNYIGPALMGAAGGVALDMAWGALTSKTAIVPASMQTGWGALAAKLAVLFGGSWALDRFVLKGSRARLISQRAVMGATTVLFYGALKGAAQSVLPAGTPGLSGYMDYHSYALPGTRMAGYMPRAGVGLGSLEDLYSPAAVIQPAGTSVPRQFGGYIAAQPGLSGYQPHMSGGGGVMSGYDWRSDGM